jgi:hypothetical protein
LIYLVAKKTKSEEEGKMLEADTLMDQTSSTVLHYMDAAIKWIDKSFGEGYSKQHPELVGAFIQACSTDFLAGILAKEVHMLSDRLQAIAEALDH